jgi:glycosyltransferase involved in cell wall biosynthesis
MAKSLAVVQPDPHLAVAALTAEAMGFGVPPVVPATGGASRSYAEESGGGLWFRGYEELLGCVEALLDEETRACLSARSHEYATSMFADSRAYIDRVCDAMQVVR